MPLYKTRNIKEGKTIIGAKNIVHLIFSLEMGGSENMLIDIANEQAISNTVSVIIINNKVDKAIASKFDKAVHVHYLKRKQGSWLNFRFVLRLWRILFKIKADVIHAHNENMILLVPFFKNKTVVTIHDIGYPVTNIKMYQKVFAISNAVKDDLNKSGVESISIANGINFAGYSKKSKYNLTEREPFRIVQVSRLLHEKKGQDILINSVHILISHYNFTSVIVELIGDGESYEYLQNLVNQLELQQYVHFLKAKDRTYVQQHLSDYHLLIQPSRFEGFGLTIIEGIAAGLPVIASAIDGPAEILKELPSGFLFETESAEDLAKQILHVYELYKDKAIEDSVHVSYKKGVTKYSIKQTAESYLQHY